MKTFLKIYFILMFVLSLIVGIIPCLTLIGALFGISQFFGISFEFLIIPLLILGVLLIIASVKFLKANNSSDEELIKKRKSLLGWGIFVAICLTVTVIGLIAVLIMVLLVNNYILSLEKNPEKANQSLGTVVKTDVQNTIEGTKETIGIKSDYEKIKEKIDVLNKLKEEGYLTEEEYNAKKRQILKI